MAEPGDEPLARDVSCWRCRGTSGLKGQLFTWERSPMHPAGEESAVSLLVWVYGLCQTGQEQQSHRTATAAEC